MSQSVRLIPLLCTRCQTMVPAHPDEVAWVCEQCGQGLLLDDERGATAMDVFFSSAIAQNGVGRPFWVARGAVTISKRLTYSGDQGKSAQEFWGQPRLFYIPAWQQEVGEIVAAGVALLRKPVGMQAGGRCKIQPVVLSPRNVQPVAEFIVMSIEAERSDAMKEMGFTVKLDPPQLWVLP